MRYELRDYQKAAVEAASTFFNSPSKTNGIMVLPTGSGKSLVIANIALALNAPVLIFQPSKEILEQNYEKLCSYGFSDVGIYSASLGRKEIRSITFATIGSVKNCAEYFGQFRYVIVDECHYVNPEQGMYRDFFEVIRCKILGLTATPYRLYSSQNFGSQLKFITRTRPRIFSSVIYHVQIGELLRRGYLANMNYYQMNVVDTSRLRLNSLGSDFSEESLRQYYQDTKFNDSLENIVKRLLRANRKSVLVFTRFVEEAQALVDSLGKDAAVVSGDMPKSDRSAILKAFKAGIIKVVANVGVLTTGFDFPELATVVMARPTMSLALWYQICGRAIRPYKDKVSWIVDLCGNFRRFGRVDSLYLHDTNQRGAWAVFNGNKQLTNVWFEK